MFACSSQSGKECKSCYTSFSSWWGCSGSSHQLCAFQPPCRDSWVGCAWLSTSKTPPALVLSQIQPSLWIWWICWSWSTITTSPMLTLSGVFACYSSLCFGFSWTNRWGMNCKWIPGAPGGQQGLDLTQALTSGFNICMVASFRWD